MMNPGTKNEIKGNFHEVKGKVKETAGQVTNNHDLEAEGIAEYNAGKVGKRVGAGQKSARELDKRALCPEHVPAFGTNDAPPFPARTAETRRIVSSEARPHIRPANLVLRSREPAPPPLSPLNAWSG